jgi:hypothetical protein
MRLVRTRPAARPVTRLLALLPLLCLAACSAQGQEANSSGGASGIGGASVTSGGSSNAKTGGFTAGGAASTGTGGSAGSPNDNASKKTLGSKGGALELNGVTVTIPPGALADDTELTVALAVPNGLPGLGAGLAFDSSIVELLPHGITFALPVTVTLPHQGFGTAVYRLADDSDPDWEPVSGVTVGPFAVTFETTAFSFYAVVRREGELVYDYEVPFFLHDGLQTLGISDLVYDRGSVYWIERIDDNAKIWRLRLDTEPGPPTLVISKPTPLEFNLSSVWTTKDHLVWEAIGADVRPGQLRLTGVLSVAKDGTGYRELPLILPTFSRNDGFVSLVYPDGNTGTDPDVYQVSPATGGTTLLSSALRDLVRRECLYDSENDTVGCVIGTQTTDGEGGGGVATFDFKTGQRKTLGRSDLLIPGTIQQNASQWLTTSLNVPRAIVIWPKIGGDFRRLDLFQEPVFAVDDEAIFMCERSAEDGRPMERIALSDLTKSQLVSGCQQVLGVDDDYVYYVGDPFPGRRYVFMRFPKR